MAIDKAEELEVAQEWASAIAKSPDDKKNILKRMMEFEGELIESCSREVPHAGIAAAYKKVWNEHNAEVNKCFEFPECFVCFAQQNELGPKLLGILYSTNLFYNQLNAALHSGEEVVDDRFCAIFTVLLNDAIMDWAAHQQQEHHAAQRKTLYRGLSRLGDDLVAQYHENVGKNIYIPCFVSTSRSKDVAAGFAGESGWLFVMHGLDQCEHAADISWMSKFPDEEEVLVGPNQCYVVKAVHEHGRTIELEYNKAESKGIDLDVRFAMHHCEKHVPRTHEDTGKVDAASVHSSGVLNHFHGAAEHPLSSHYMSPHSKYSPAHVYPHH